MKKLKPINILFAIIILFLTVCIFVYPEDSINGAKNGLKVCGNVVIPSLFPFLIISSFFVKSGLASGENRATKFISEKIFNLPTASLSVILMSMIGGFPVGVRMTDELFKDGEINENEAERLSLFCVNAGPAFVINAVGISLLANKKAGILIFVALTVTSLSIGFLTRFFAKGEIIKNRKIKEEKNISASLVESVSESTVGMISICSWIVLFSTFTALINNFNLGVSGDFIKGIFEVTTGCMIFSEKYSISAVAGIIGFGGLCVHCQILPNLHNMKVRLSRFFLSRVCSGVLSILICKLLLKIFPCELQVFSNISEAASAGMSVSIPAVCSLFFMCGLLILDLSLDRCKKIC